MESQTLGKRHGLAARNAAALAAAFVVALGKDLVFNVRRGTDYGRGFVHGLVRGDHSVPNA